MSIKVLHIRTGIESTFTTILEAASIMQVPIMGVKPGVTHRGYKVVSVDFTSKSGAKITAK